MKGLVNDIPHLDQVRQRVVDLAQDARLLAAEKFTDGPPEGHVGQDEEEGLGRDGWKGTYGRT